ncbi:WXG100 family type VII secretion target [Bacillus sp. BP-3]|uniref:WXG100 family type VII secretion target n=1 Tax=Bacillus sp. BP-3 TaxID=3022773 RepID=UPI00232B8701|nr:WXG100 family type VII secretion target [Bacillus sp. BP-3]MDC2863492.1 WXG100 family type VII secretion target [Bacillus sp. BP-3]
MGQVRVDPDKLEAAADSISRNRQDIERIIQRLLQVTFELQMSWEGIARQRFFDEFFSKKKSMDDLVQLLQHLELELKKTAKTFREVDEKAAGDFNQMGKLWDAFQRGGGRAAGDTIFDPLKKAWNQTSDFFGHLVDDPMDALEDAKYGLTDFVESYVDGKKEKFKDTYEFIGDLWNDPIGTLKSEWDEEVQEMYAIRNVLSDWYVKNVEYGDAESFTEATAYGLTSFAIAALVTKGAGAVGSGARWGSSLSSMSEIQLGSRLEPAFAGGSSLEYKLGNVYQEANNKLSPYQYTKSSSDGDTFVGKLYGEDVHLKDVKVEDITYSKRAREEAEQLRKEFDRSVRKDFLNSLINDPIKLVELKKAGLTDADIERMKEGNNPKGWQVHHNFPLDDGGTNDFENLTLIQNHPYHKAITNTQRTLTKHLEPGDSVDISWPIPKHNIYPKGE